MPVVLNVFARTQTVLGPQGSGGLPLPKPLRSFWGGCRPLRGLRSEPTIPGVSIRGDNHSGGVDPRQPLRGANHSGGFDPRQSRLRASSRELRSETREPFAKFLVVRCPAVRVAIKPDTPDTVDETLSKRTSDSTVQHCRRDLAWVCLLRRDVPQQAPQRCELRATVSIGNEAHREPPQPLHQNLALSGMCGFEAVAVAVAVATAERHQPERG